jgi:general secretion pathway protein A
MYLKYYSLQERPFQTAADPKYFWLGEKQKEALTTIKYGITDKEGLLLLTGEAGTGKTFMTDLLVSKLDINAVVATLPDSNLESMDFYNMLGDGFEMGQTFDSKGAFLIHLREFLMKSYEDQKRLLLIIDNCQRLNASLMDDLRVLSNIELHDQKLINLFFVGEQAFNKILLARQNRSLAQRITTRYHIEPLTIEETGHYIAHRLKIGGSGKSIFKPSAIRSVHDFSGGAPKLINLICDHALMTGCSRNMRQLDAELISDCANKLGVTAGKIAASAAALKAQESFDKFVDSEAELVDQEAEKPGDFVPEEAGADLAGKVSRQQSTGWRLVYAGVILSLVALVAFAITQFTAGQTPRWGEDELTPQKYKTTLQREKEILSGWMNQNGEATTDKADAAKPQQPPEKGEQAAATDAGQSDAGEALAPLSRRETENGALKPLPLIKDKIIIQFRLNSNEIEDRSYAVLERIAAYLAQNRDERIFIKGYTDSMGVPSYNESVSKFRANAVKSYIIGKGANPQQIVAFGLGAENPIASNDTAQGRHLNRRVEIEFAQSITPSK